MWSQVAAAHEPTRNNATPHPQKQGSEGRKNRELIVTITEVSERETVRGRSIEEILGNIRAKEPKTATDNIIVLRQLPSNDYLVITLTENSRIELKKTTDWL